MTISSIKCLFWCLIGTVNFRAVNYTQDDLRAFEVCRKSDFIEELHGNTGIREMKKCDYLKTDP